MAKKKKAAVNPARGFATTSIPSKTKPEKDSVVEPAENSGEAAVNAPAESSTAATQSIIAKDVVQQTPEELEKQLENDELQLLVEKHSAKIRRDASRLEARIQTDCRVLRGQATNIPLAPFLPEELKLQLIDLVQKDALETGHCAQHISSAKDLTEEDTTIKCWTLFEALLSLGISQESIKSVISELLTNPPTSDASAYVWGFREALDFLALSLDEDQLPSYATGKTNVVSDEKNAEENSSSEVSSDSIPTPMAKIVSSRLAPQKTILMSEDPAESDLHASDFESDVEPENLLTTYLEIKERLYRHRPTLVETPAASKKWKKPTFARPPSGTMTPKELKLTNKLRTIEADILFDKREADYTWDSRKQLIMREEAMVSKFNPHSLSAVKQNGTASTKPSPDTPMDTSETTDSGDEDLLGALFSATIDDHPSPSSASVDNGELTVWMRDFGKVIGMNPRRVLEDACRARNPKADVSFHLVSPTTYACRHSVNVKWTKDQDMVPNDTVPYIKLQQMKSSRSSNQTFAMRLTMTAVATPDVQQSEAFAATATLFYLFSSSSKEDKTYMKLPAVWRELYAEFGEARKQNVDAEERERLKMIKSIVQQHNQREEEDGIVLASAFRSRNLDSPRSNTSRNISPSKASPLGPSNDLISLWDRVRSTPNYQRMLQSRVQLPMFHFKEAALAAIDQNQVLILCGETGCGKSTQLPAYILEHQLSQGKQCKIYCTEPRRISAISLAQRVSEELGENQGDVGTYRSLVGYAIRLESKTTPQTRLIYATVGVVLRMLESFRGLTDLTHLVIDEVHERSIDTDFLLIVLKTLMIERPELKIILMSATVDATRFSKYLNNAPVITVPGRTFPVGTRYLEDAIELTNYVVATNTEKTIDDDDDGTVENATSGIPKQLPGYKIETRNALANYDEYRMDYELIVNLMEKLARDPAYVKYNKATLVFLPGIAEIRELNDMLVGSPTFSRNCWVIPLHSSIASEEQQHAFLEPPHGVRKVVLATNIAETGITIPDVTCVIDTGKHKEMRYDERRQLSRLIQSFISKANAKQRRGRAGRVQEGICFHLFTKYRHDELMAAQQTPEMLRLSLQDLVMRVKICGLGAVEETLSRALDPPSSKNIRRAIDALIEVGALTPTEDLTPLGNQLAKLPLDANLGKLCILAALFNCLDVGLTIAAILSSKSPFVTPFGEKQRAETTRLAFAKGNSDLLTAYNAYSSWRRVSQNQASHISPFTYCRKNYLSHQNLQNIEDLKGQLLSSLADTGLIQVNRRRNQPRSKGRTTFVEVPEVYDTNSPNDTLTSTILSWSFYPKLLLRDGKGWRNISNAQSVTLHPSSVNKTPSHNPNSPLKLLSYYSMLQTSGSKHYNALSTTAVSELPLLIGVGDVEFRTHAGVLVLDGNRGRWKVDEWKVMMGLKMLRGRLSEFVEGRLKDPGKEGNGGERLRRWVDLFERICGRDSVEKA